MSPKVFIIILNWNNWSDSLECLESLENNDYHNYQVVIIDNGSKEKPQAPSPEIKIIYNKENLGFSGGNNMGIKYALENGADYVLLLNDDTIAAPDFLSRLVEAGESDEKIGAVGPKIYFYEDRNRIWSAGGKLNWLYNKGSLRGWDQMDKGQYDFPKIQETPHLTGCCVLVKKEVIEKIGLMPEDYFLYYEDTDWLMKARRAGYKCIFVPEAKIWHKISRSALAESSLYIYYHVRNGLIFAQRFAPWYIKPFVYLDVGWRIIKQIIKLVLMPKKRSWAKAILLGIKDFYLGRRGKFKD